MPIFAHADLETWLTTIFAAQGLAEADAALTARHLVRANLRGVDTHGLLRLPSYVKMLKAGETNPKPNMTVSDREGMLVVDADSAIGQVGGTFALKKGMEAVQNRGLVGVAIRNVGHLGALGLFVEEAAHAGFASIMMQNGPAIMALPGSQKAGIGNNPLAFAAPVRGGPPLVFDMAASEVAFGRIMDHARTETPLKPGWALDAQGQPTLDPKAALRGMLLPAGGYKGIGLAMLVETFAGSLTGLHAAASIAPGQQLPTRFGAMLLLFNPEKIIGCAVFDDHITAWLADYKASAADARYPGENTARLEIERRHKGILLPDALVAEMDRIANEAGIPRPAAIG